MRRLLTVVLLATAACSKVPEKAAAAVRPVALTFDGSVRTDRLAVLAHGERLTWVLGCRGCHREQLQGGSFYERYASNLTRELPKYSAAQIEHVLRSGIPRDGRELWGMPSDIFQHLSAADMADLIAELRTLHPEGKATQPPKPWTKEAKDLIAKGELKPAADFVREEKSATPVDLGQSYALGRYLTMVSCAECHGPRLEGHPGDTPNLVVAGGYSRAEFETLMTKGVPSGGRKFKNPLMGEVARERFVRFTPHERDALYAYLKARAQQPQ